jgi:hypothetical protein
MLLTQASRLQQVCRAAVSTWIGCFGVVNERSSLRLRSRCVTTVHSNITSIPSVNRE